MDRPSPRPSPESLTPDQLKELEGDWRAGLLSVRVIAAKFRLDVDALRRYAKRAGWEAGDLAADIRGATTTALVQRAVGETLPDGLTPDARETVRKYGQIVASVIEGQRTDIARARRRVQQYIADLEALDGPEIDEDAINGLVELISDSNPELAKLLKRPKPPLLPIARSLELLDAKAAILKNLVASEAKLIELQRQAYALDEKGKGDGATYDDFLAELYGEDNGNPTQQGRLN